MKKNTAFSSDDQAVFRIELRRLLEARDDTDIIGEAARLLKRCETRARQSKSKAAPALTRRQAEVLKMIAEGYPSRRMARLLALSIKTIEKHRQSLMDRLDIHEIATLTRYAVSSGFVEMKPYAQLTSHPHWNTQHSRSIRPISTSLTAGNGRERDANKVLAGAITSASKGAGGCFPPRLGNDNGSRKRKKNNESLICKHEQNCKPLGTDRGSGNGRDGPAP